MKLKQYQRTFDFGKIDYNATGRKINAVSIDVELKDLGDGKWEFTACGDIWNSKHTDCLCCGQCLDTISEYVHTPIFKEIYRLWKAYHLNGMNAGTLRQEQAIIEKFGSENASRYSEECDYLASIDLLEDKEYLYNGKPYKYGSAWLYREIPSDDIRRIVTLLNDGDIA